MKYTLLKVIAIIALILPQAAPMGCSKALQAAVQVANTLQSKYYDKGSYKGGSHWTDCNALEDLANLMIISGKATWDSAVMPQVLGPLSFPSYAKTFASPLEWTTLFNGSYDDAQWAILFYYKMVDYLTWRKQSTSSWLKSGTDIYSIVQPQWDTKTCGGGVWWSKAHNYKNAITNELYILTSAESYLKTKQQSYLTNAKNEWNWFKNCGMKGGNGLYNDGLTFPGCKNNGQTVWTYNQGVIASGLAALSVATNDASLLAQAEQVLDAAIKQMTTNGVLTESCDGGSCNPDQSIFKGVFMKHLMYYLDFAGASHAGKYSGFINNQMNAILGNAMQPDNTVYSAWNAKKKGSVSPQSMASALAALNAAAKYGTC